MRTAWLPPQPVPPVLPAPVVYADKMARLIERAQAGDLDAFGAVVLRDEMGHVLDLASLHRMMTAHILYCWYPELRPTGDQVAAYWERLKYDEATARGEILDLRSIKVFCDQEAARAEHERTLGHFYAGILAPWRHGKTLLGPIRVSLFKIGQNPNIRIRLVCGSDREATDRVSAVRRYLLSPPYQWVFPHIKAARQADWTKHRFFVDRTSLGPDPTLSAAGIFDSEAGGGNDVVIFDDIATYQNMILKPALRQQVFDTATSVWLRRIDPETRVLAVGTVWHADDPYNLWRAQKETQWRWMVMAVGESLDDITYQVEG